MSTTTTKDVTVYFAAGLFKAAQTHLNIRLCHLLETMVKRVYLPQRDGFEFSKLTAELAAHLSAEEAGTALQTIIYLLDLGIYVHNSDVVIANFDEPLDEGVVVEAVWGRMINKYTVAFRTDVRSPYGNLSDPLRGMHFFPAFQAHRFIWHSIVPTSVKAADTQEWNLFSKLLRAIEQRSESYPVARNIYHVDAVRERALFLFEGIDDVHLDVSLGTIVNRYLTRRTWLAEIGPIVVPQ
jgi:nucleoside 2-deoxyribosyltransferase